MQLFSSHIVRGLLIATIALQLRLSAGDIVPAHDKAANIKHLQQSKLAANTVVSSMNNRHNAALQPV